MAQRLERIQTGQLIGGVCNGVADYFDISVVLVRIIFIILLFTGGGFLIYLVLWIAMPLRESNYYFNHMENDEKHASHPPQEGRPNSGSIFAGVILIALGSFFILKDYIDIDLRELWPYALIAVGVFLILKGMQKN